MYTLRTQSSLYEDEREREREFEDGNVVGWLDMVWVRRGLTFTYSRFLLYFENFLVLFLFF